MDQEEPKNIDQRPIHSEKSVESHRGERATNPIDSRSWAAKSAPTRRASSVQDGFDFDALKIFLILAGLTAGMALALMLVL